MNERNTSLTSKDLEELEARAKKRGAFDVVMAAYAARNFVTPGPKATAVRACELAKAAWDREDGES